MTLLDELVRATHETLESGYYRHNGSLRPAPSLVAAIAKARETTDPAIIAEVKPATPTRGKLVKGGLKELTHRFVREGACALSVLTEPRHFHGSLANLKNAVETGVPVIMKDFIVDERQIDCAAAHGASAVLLIAQILEPKRLDALIEYAHLAEREVLLECATREEVEHALHTKADLIGVNNRDLTTFDVDLGRTRRCVQGLPLDRPLVSLSGFQTRKDVEGLRGIADAVLVGSSLVDGTTSVKELLGDSA